MRHDILSDVFSAIRNAETIGKKSCTTAANGIARDVLKVLQEHEYIGAFEYQDNGRGGKFTVTLTGRINECGAVRPRFSVGKNEFIAWEKRFLPGSEIGILILSTSKGIMDQRKAKKMGVGGKLLGYCF